MYIFLENKGPLALLKRFFSLFSFLMADLMCLQERYKQVRSSSIPDRYWLNYYF